MIIESHKTYKRVGLQPLNAAFRSNVIISVVRIRIHSVTAPDFIE